MEYEKEEEDDSSEEIDAVCEDAAMLVLALLVTLFDKDAVMVDEKESTEAVSMFASFSFRRGGMIDALFLCLSLYYSTFCKLVEFADIGR